MRFAVWMLSLHEVVSVDLYSDNFITHSLRIDETFEEATDRATFRGCFLDGVYRDVPRFGF